MPNITLPAIYNNAASRPADVTQRMVELANVVTAINTNLPNFSTIETGLTAHAGGTQAAALALSTASNVHNVTIVATAADSVSLPPAVAGVLPQVVINSAASNSMQVFGAGTDTINDVATATGVAQAAKVAAFYISPVVGKWYRIQSS